MKVRISVLHSYSKSLSTGNAVSWNWGGGKPGGTVAEVQTEGKLELELKSKTVHKNADPSNPAVHVAREGNDVVKRASELIKETSGDNIESEGSKDATKDEKAKNSGRREGKASEGDDSEKVGGEKRERTENTSGPPDKAMSKEQEEAEKDTGKEVKKAKVHERKKEHEAAEESGNATPKKKTAGRSKKSETGTKEVKMKNRSENTEKISARTRSKMSS